MLEIIESIGADIFSEQFEDSPQLVAFLEAHFAGIENTSARRQLLEAADESEFRFINGSSRSVSQSVARCPWS